MEFLHPTMWRDHDIDFARWLHPAMWHVALGSWQWIHRVAVGLPATWHMALGWYVIEFARWHVTLESWQWIRPVAAPCNMTRSDVAVGSWHWNRRVAAPCNVAGGSGIRPTCHWIRPNVRNIGILLLVSISAISPQSTCHYAPVCEILSKSDHPRQKKWRNVHFQDGSSPPS